MASNEDSSYQPVIVSAQGVRQVADPPKPKELVDKYSGVGLQFRVKFVGSENVNRKRGDAEAARYCLPTLRLASKSSKAHKPKAVLGLNLKGISLYDERSKSITRVPVDKITFVTHDPGDVCYFGCIIQTKESHTGFKLYCFKAEKHVAINFVSCARELFDLMYKLRQARKKLKEEREKADAQTANQNPDEHSLPPENAPPPSYISVSSNTPPDRPPPPRPNQPPALPPRPEGEQTATIHLAPPPQQSKDRKQTALDEWNQLEGELSNISQDLSRNTNNKRDNRIPSYPPPAFDELDDIFSSPPPATTAAAPVQQQPNPFGGFSQPPPTQPLPTQPLPTLPLPTQPLPTQPPPQQQQQQFGFQAEPSITMDLMDAINKPVPGTTTYNMGMGSGMGGMMAPGMGGPGMGMGMGGMGGPGMGMGGPGMGGPGMGGPGMGGPGMGGSGMGGPGMGGPGMGGPGMGGPGGNPFGNPQPATNTDIFSLPADPLLNTTFSQPLLPQSSAPQPQQEQKQSLDFSDLVTIARAKTAFEGEKKSSPMLPPPPSGRSKPTEAVDTGSNILGGGMDAGSNVLGGGSLFGDMPAPTGGNMFGDMPPPATTQVSQGFGGFDDTFGSTTATGGGFGDAFGGAPVSTSLPPPQDSSWISF